MYYSPNAPRGCVADEDIEVCNLYNQTMAADAMRHFSPGLKTIRATLSRAAFTLIGWP